MRKAWSSRPTALPGLTPPCPPCPKNTAPPPLAPPPNEPRGTGTKLRTPNGRPPDELLDRGHLTGREGVATDPVEGQTTCTGSRPVGPVGAPDDGSDDEGGEDVEA